VHYYFLKIFPIDSQIPISIKGIYFSDDFLNIAIPNFIMNALEIFKKELIDLISAIDGCIA